MSYVLQPFKTRILAPGYLLPVQVLPGPLLPRGKTWRLPPNVDQCIIARPSRSYRAHSLQECC